MGRLAREDGDVVLPYTFTIAASLLLFVMLANAIVAMYGRGVVRGALDEAVRTGSRAPNGAAECELKAAEALGQLLGGPMGDGVEVACADQGDRIVASADVVFEGWLPGVPDFAFTVGATAVKEQLP